MKHTKFLFAAALILGLLTSVSAHARTPSCQKTPFIDVRGNASIDGALGPKDGKVTIAEVAVANPLNNLGTLVTAVLAADPAVLAAISDPSANLTVLAPDDTAFANLPDGVLDVFLGDSDLLTDVLLYHVVGGQFDPRKIVYIFAIDSLLGQTLFFQRGFRSGSQPSVNQSAISCTGVKTDNGLVWLIDSVLLPQY